VPNLAPQMRTVFSSIARKTGSNSPGELLMTLSISDVAVCCSSDSLSSRVRCCSASKRRTFSMAMTAWSAKVCANSICLSVNGSGLFLERKITPTTFPSRNSGTPSATRKPPIFCASCRV
jgi:hypothetical protein